MDSRENEGRMEFESIGGNGGIAGKDWPTVRTGPYAGQFYCLLPKEPERSFSSWWPVMLRDSLGDLVERDVRLEDL